MTPRGPIVILLCLLLGALTTIALAMACAAVSNPTAGPGQPQAPIVPGLNDLVVAQHSFGHTRLNNAQVDVMLNEHTGQIISCRWMHSDDSVSRTRAGWPWRALECVNHGEVTILLDTTDIRHAGIPPPTARPGAVGGMAMRSSRSGLRPLDAGWDLSDFTGGTMGSTWRAIPLRPRWPGLIADIIFFAVAWWLLLVGGRLARRRVRRSRGLCPMCGYDLLSGGLMHARCPECGKLTGHPTPETSPLT